MALLQTHNQSGVANGSGSSYKPALIVLGVLYFMMGFITCLNDTLVPYFKNGFQLNYAQSSLVQFYFFLTYAIMSVPSGKIVEKVGYKKGMVIGFAIAGGGAFLFLPAAWLHQYPLFLGALFILAIGIVLLQVAANPYITLLGRPETASSRLTLIQGVGSLGTTAAPLFGAYFILAKVTAGASEDNVSGIYTAIGMILLLIAFGISFIRLPDAGRKKEDINIRSKATGGIFAFRNLNFGLPAIFMYVGAEVAIGTFLTNYIADLLRIEEHLANRYVSFYWGGMLVGRFAGAALLKYAQPQRVLVFAASGACALIITSLLSSGNMAVWTMIAVGVCNSVMFAIIFSLSVKGLGAYTTQASGLLSMAIVGGAVIPYLKGLLVDNASWQWGFLLPFICYVYIVFYGANGYKTAHQQLN